MSVYAQEYGYFFNSNNSDRKYNAESFETWLKPFFVSGVFTGGLQVSAQSTPDMSVQVSAGYANLDGKLGYWNESNTLTLETASGVYSRYDTIVLRRDNTNRTVSIEVVTGTASGSPSPTPPTRNGDIFELVLAQILVGVGVTEITASKIEDKRPDDTVCGYVVAAVQTPDFSELYAQFTAQAEEFMGEQAAEFLAWFDEMKDQLSEDAAGHLQNEIDDINDTIGDVPAGKNLQGEIGDIESEINTLEEGLAIVVDGNKTAHVGGAAVGNYVLVKNSTITDILDGGYTAAKAIPENTAIDKTYLTPCSKGIANSLSDQIGTIDSQLGQFGNMTLLKTSAAFSQSVNISFDATGYRFLLVAVHTGSDPNSAVWLSQHLFPINIYSRHTSSHVFNFVTGGGSTYFDLRLAVGSTFISGAFDSKVNINNAYVTVYGVK